VQIANRRETGFELNSSTPSPSQFIEDNDNDNALHPAPYLYWVAGFCELKTGNSQIPI
jgi:hypothetical protein